MRFWQASFEFFEGDAPFVEGFADDDAPQARRSSSPMSFPCRGDAAADGDLHPRNCPLTQRRIPPRGRKHPVAGDVGADDLCEPLRCEAAISFCAVISDCSVHPCTATAPSRMSAPRISFPPNSASHSAKRSGSRTARLPQMARPALASKTLRSGLAALDSAAVLHFERGFRRHAFQHGEVAGLRRLGAVEIDHVQAADARLFEAQRRFQRVAVVGFPAGVVALRQAHARRR